MEKDRSFIETAMHHHRIVILIVTMLVGVGIYGLVKIPKQEIPTITIRQGLVVAAYPGATSGQVEERVAKPLENFIFEYKEVDKQKTYSVSKDGLALVYVELNEDVEDRDAFWSKFKHGLEGFKSSLPAGVAAVQAMDDVGDTSSLLITLSSRQKTYRELSRYLEDLEDRLRREEAISRLRHAGLQEEQITVTLDQARLSQYGLGIFTVANQLALRGFTTTGGSLDDGTQATALHVPDSYHSEYEVGRQIVYSDPAGRVVRLRDVADIRREYPQADKYIQSGGTKCVLLSVEMREGYDIVAMGRRVHKELETFKQTLPDDVKVDIITDQSKVVQDSVLNFLRELVIAVVSVVLVVMFLMPMRVAGVAAISIPTTIFIALALFYIFGIELNTVTLAALIVTLGMIVDDSVVIIDNYIEKLGQGYSRWHAAYAAPNEFFFSVLSATLSISVTFFPFLFTMHGAYGDFVQSFPWAMLIILGISLLVSLLLTPFLQYFFIHKGIEKKETGGENEGVQDAARRKGRRFPFPIPAALKRFSPLNLLQSGYDRLLTGCFNHPWLTLGAGLASIAVGGILFAGTPQRLMPIAERNQFAVEFYLPEGTAAPRTALVADSLRHILEKDRRVTGITTFIGQGSPRFHSTYAPQVGGTNFAQFIVNTTGPRATEQMLDEYADRYADFFPEAYVRFKQMDYADATYPIELRLSGDSTCDLLAAGEVVERAMKGVPGLKLVRTNYEEARPGVSVTPREPEADRLGVNKAALSAELALHFGKGVPAATIWEDDYPVSVVLRSGREAGDSLSALAGEYIPVLGGARSVPLRQVADIRPDWTQGSIVRRGGIRTLSVVAEPMRGYNENELNAAALKAVPRDSLPQGVTLSAGGIMEKDAETMPMVVGGVGIAVLIIFFILLFHFTSIPLALINLASVGLCTFGAAAGLRLLGMDLSITAILGVVSLMGILVRNGIIMLDYAEELRRDQGFTVRMAAFHAGSRRMRPIFLTSAAASVGVLPMIFENSALWTPMGTVIFFGTLISMVLISTVLPVAYWLAFRRQDRKRRLTMQPAPQTAPTQA